MFDVLTLLMRCALLQCGKGFNARGTFLEISLTIRFHFFQRQFGQIYCIILTKEFDSLMMVTIGIGKIQSLSYHSNICYEEKKLHQKLESFRFKLPLKKNGVIRSVQGEINYHNLKNFTVQKMQFSKISVVNVTKSAETEKILNGKLHFCAVCTFLGKGCKR